MKATIKDVAKAAGVSASTVSRALHDNPRISQQVRDNIRRIADEMDFHPNLMARSLVNRQTRIVGVVFPDDLTKNLANPFYPSMLQGLGHAANEQHYQLLLITGSESVSARQASREALDGGYVSGLIYLTAEDAAPVHDDVPVVVIGHPSGKKGRCHVDNNNVRAGAEAADYLLSKGHHCIAVCGFDKRYNFTVDRKRGIAQRLAENGTTLDPKQVFGSVLTKDCGVRKAAEALFLSPDRPTAVICMDDAEAIALTGLVKELGLSVPNDVSLISFNNTDAARYHSPSLTTFDLDPYGLGISAMKLMIQLITGETVPSASIEVPFHLVERDSVITLNE